MGPSQTRVTEKKYDSLFEITIKDADFQIYNIQEIKKSAEYKFYRWRLRKKEMNVQIFDFAHFNKNTNLCICSENFKSS